LGNAEQVSRARRIGGLGRSETPKFFNIAALCLRILGFQLIPIRHAPNRGDLFSVSLATPNGKSGLKQARPRTSSSAERCSLAFGYLSHELAPEVIRSRPGKNGCPTKKISAATRLRAP
jgi:hypothetical protein